MTNNSKNYLIIKNNEITEQVFHNHIANDWITTGFELYKIHKYGENHFVNDSYDNLLMDINIFVNQVIDWLPNFNQHLIFKFNNYDNENITIISPKMNNKNQSEILKSLFEPSCYLDYYDRFASDNYYYNDMKNYLKSYEQKIDNFLKEKSKHKERK